MATVKLFLYIKILSEIKNITVKVYFLLTLNFNYVAFITVLHINKLMIYIYFFLSRKNILRTKCWERDFYHHFSIIILYEQILNVFFKRKYKRYFRVHDNKNHVFKVKSFDKRYKKTSLGSL